MSETLLILLCVACVAVAAWFAHRAQQAREEAVREKARGEGVALIREERDRAVAERDRAMADVQRLGEELAGERAGAAARRQAVEEKEQALLAMKAEVEKTFESMANRALGQSEQRFLTLANETFQKHQSAAAGNVKEVVTPVQEQFTQLAAKIAALDTARTEDRSALAMQMAQISELVSRTQSETHKLVTVLRASPKTRGRWGEETLKNVLEISGLSEHVDFTEQSSTRDDDGKVLRPDVIIRLPGGRSIVVDAKVALSGYLDAMDAPDDALREAHLKKHALELRAHVKALSSKDYSKAIGESADFVALFVPGENFFAAAVEQDPSLFEDAMKARVVIVTPVTLMALARSIAYGWRQEKSAKNAQEIAELGRELYSRLSLMSERMASVGGAIESSVKRYNEMVGTFDSRVLPSARRFKELGATESGGEIAAAPPVDSAPRMLAARAELDFGAAAPTPTRKKGAG